MWYFAWILGTMLACSLSLITVLAVEHQDGVDGTR